MSSHKADLIVIGCILAAVFVVAPFVVWHLRKHVLERDRLDAPRRCKVCGYNLTGQTVPRCPECGTALGFDKTFGELGIDEAEVIRHIESKRSRDQSPDT